MLRNTAQPYEALTRPQYHRCEGIVAYSTLVCWVILTRPRSSVSSKAITGTLPRARCPPDHPHRHIRIRLAMRFAAAHHA